MKILLLFSLLLWQQVNADNVAFNLTSDNTIEAKVYQAKGKQLILYLPSTRGLGQEYPVWANDLNFDGIDVWALDLHQSYMVNKTKSSIDKFNIDDITQVINLAKKQGFNSIYLLTSGRGAKLALKAAYSYQNKYKDNFIKGHIFHSPHLIKGNPKIGTQAQYEQIASYSNLPIYIIISQYGTKYLRITEISNLLQQGGSKVFVHLLKNTSGGFFMRKNNDLTTIDINNKAKLASFYQNAMRLLNNTAPATLTTINIKDDTTAKTNFNYFLQPINKVAEDLVLFDLDNNKFNLQDAKEQVVLLNFWASWCKPCVEEIPSLMRLKEKVNNDNFKIITVNIGESKAKIMKFKKKVKFDLTVLLDDGNIARKWKIYAYPSNYIIDNKAVIRYGYRGALKWDRDDIVATIKELL